MRDWEPSLSECSTVSEVPGQQRRAWAGAGPTERWGLQRSSTLRSPAAWHLALQSALPGPVISHGPRQGCARPCSPQPTHIRALFLCCTLPRIYVLVHLPPATQVGGDFIYCLHPQWLSPQLRTPHLDSSPLLTLLPPPPYLPLSG